jgi:tetratricopeptide (TPR) repeat protein
MRAKNIRNIFILAALFLLLFLEAGFAFDDQETGAFSRANVYYEQGNYGEAIKQYEGILKSGWESGNLYYNLGNCYFKKGELGKAILNYEKARRLIPFDKDLDSNYEYAQSLIKGAEIASKKSFLSRILSSMLEKITIDGLTILIDILYILILIAVLFGLFLNRLKRQALVLSILLGLFFIVGFVGLRGKIALLNREGVVIVEQVDAKFEPMDKATAYFTLYEGMKVEVTSSKDNWYKVRRQDNKSGWVEKSTLALF